MIINQVRGINMPNVVFFSFSEYDRDEVTMIKGRAMNSSYYNLNFRVHDLLTRWDTSDQSVIRQAITKSIQGTSRTIVFVGNHTHTSYWVKNEVEMTLEANKPVYAIRINSTFGSIPLFLSNNNIRVDFWSEQNLQRIATQ